MDVYKELKLVKSEGITAIVVNKNRVLVMKRIWAPFGVVYPGVWTFVAGRRNGKEPYEETAYREIFEETGLKRKDLKLISKHAGVVKVDERKRRRWRNHLYVFRTRASGIKLNFENTDYRWTGFSEIEKEKRYTNVFENERLILRIIGKAIRNR